MNDIPQNDASSSPVPAENHQNTLQKMSYTLKEKYLQVEPEGRIRRYQYFVRWLIPGIIFYIAIAAILPIVASILLPIFGATGIMAMAYSAMLITLLTQVLYMVIFYKLGVTLITKRSHDFGSDGKIAVNIFKVQLLMTTISILITIFSLMDISIPGTGLIATIGQIVGICNLIMGIILLFRPGNKGDNQYGKDPINTKVSFLG